MHVIDTDKRCELCGMRILVHVPHECDPFVCLKCVGKGCKTCSNTGRWKPPECGEDCKVCNPK